MLDNADGSDKLHIGQIVSILWRRKFFIVFAILGTLALSALTIRSFTPLYTADALLVLTVLPQVRPFDADHEKDPGPGRDEHTIRTQVEILRSPALALQVVRALGLTADPEFNASLRPRSLPNQLWSASLEWLSDWATQRGLLDAPRAPRNPAAAIEQRVLLSFLKGVFIENDGKSYVIHMAFRSQDAGKSATIVNELAQLYLQNQVQAKYEAAASAADWLRTKLAELRQKQLAAERAVQQFREQSNLTQVNNGGADSPLVSIEIVNLSRDLTEARAARAKAESEFHDAQAISISGGGSVSSSGSQLSDIMRELRSKLNTLEQRRAALLSTYGPKHPTILEIDADLAQTRADIEFEVSRIRAALSAQVRIEKNREDAIQASLAALENAYQQNNRATIELSQLENDASAARTVLQTFLQQSLKTSAQIEVQQPDARLVAPAEPPQFPSFPNNRVLGGISVIAALVLALIAVIVAESLDKGLRDTDEVERLFGVPVLGMIPLFRVKRGIAKAVSDALDNSRSVFTESVRAVGTVMQATYPRRNAHVVLVTSALPGEGKTTLAASLARIFANAGKRVLAIDCDLRSPSLGTHFDAAPGPGLAEVLDGSAAPADTLHFDPASGVRVISAGGDGRAGVDFLRPTNLNLLLQWARRDHDVIILDCPPVGVVNDALLLAKMANAIVLTVQWGATPRAIVRAAMRKLHNANVHPLGIVLTKVNLTRHARYKFEHDTYGYLKSYAQD